MPGPLTYNQIISPGWSGPATCNAVDKGSRFLDISVDAFSGQLFSSLK